MKIEEITNKLFCGNCLEFLLIEKMLNIVQKNVNIYL